MLATEIIEQSWDAAIFSNKASASEKANDEQKKLIQKHLKVLIDDSSDHECVEACTGLTTIFKSNPSLTSQILSLGGVIPLMQLLSCSGYESGGAPPQGKIRSEQVKSR